MTHGSLIRAALVGTVAALALAGAARAEPTIPTIGPLGYGVEPVCEYCVSFSGTITAPADAVAIRRADWPYESLAYSHGLQQPCPWRISEPSKAKECPPVLQSGPFQFGWGPEWSGGMLTFTVWAERPVRGCTASEPAYCEHHERCSPSQTVTLPATITVACRATAIVAKRHRKYRRRK
jgi:hypothetical protein